MKIKSTHNDYKEEIMMMNKGAKETVVLRRWEYHKIIWFYQLGHCKKIRKLTFRVLALCRRMIMVWFAWLSVYSVYCLNCNDRVTPRQVRRT